MSTCDGSSLEASRRCTIVPTELVKPPILRVAWTLRPTGVWEATEWQIDVVQGLLGKCVLGQSGYMSKEWATGYWIQHRPVTEEISVVCAWSCQLRHCISCGRLLVFFFWRQKVSRSQRCMSGKARWEFGKAGLSGMQSQKWCHLMLKWQKFTGRKKKGAVNTWHRKSTGINFKIFYSTYECAG